jgi:hypothetical protein
MHLVDVHVVVEQRDDERDRRDDSLPQPEPEPGNITAYRRSGGCVDTSRTSCDRHGQ